MRVPIHPPFHPTGPQIHSNKHHNAYNGAAHLPRAVSVKRATAASRPTSRPRPRGDPLYAVTLYYEHNRACTIFRGRDYFVCLERGLPIRIGPDWTEENIHPLDLQKLLEDAVEKCPREVALEWVLRRRMGDCGC